MHGGNLRSPRGRTEYGNQLACHKVDLERQVPCRYRVQEEQFGRLLHAGSKNICVIIRYRGSNGMVPTDSGSGILRQAFAMLACVTSQTYIISVACTRKAMW